MERFRTWVDDKAIGSEHPNKLVCTVAPPAAMAEIELAWSGHPVDRQAIELWLECREALLFHEFTYGQWGLQLLSPQASFECTAMERVDNPDNMREDDVVIGRFVGDVDLLILAPSEPGEDKVLVKPEYYPRSDWYRLGSRLPDFLSRYFEGQGDKYWEVYLQE